MPRKKSTPTARKDVGASGETITLVASANAAVRAVSALEEDILRLEVPTEQELDMSSTDLLPNTDWMKAQASPRLSIGRGGVVGEDEEGETGEGEGEGEEGEEERDEKSKSKSKGKRKRKGKEHEMEQEEEDGSRFADAQPPSHDFVDCSLFETDDFYVFTEFALRERLGAAGWAFSKVFVPQALGVLPSLRDGSGTDEAPVACSWASLIGNRSATTWAVGERRNIATAVHALVRSGHLRLRHRRARQGDTHGSLRVYLSRDFVDGGGAEG